MVKGWMVKRKQSLLFGLLCLAAYLLLPLAIHPFLCLFGIFPLVCLAAGIGFSLWGGFHWEQPVLATALFVPAMFLHYNETAWIYLPVYGVISLIGCSAGAWFRRARQREENNMLELQDISFHVADESGTLEIIDGINLKVEDGKFVVVTGPNGGGKSTIAKLIMGIEKPTSGKIIWNGTDITGLSVTERARMGIGYAFQQPPRFKGMTVRKLISLAHGSDLPEDECCHYLSSVGLCSRDYLNREVDNSLSGGEVKRIEIATLMARELKLSIYDEPEAGIDLWSFAMLVDSFRALNSRHNESVLIISHQERIIQLADEIVVIADGKIREQGPRDEIFPRLMGEVGPACCFQKGGSAQQGKARDHK